MISQVKWKTPLVFLDVFVIHFKTVADHLTYCREILQLLHTEWVTLQLLKCTFFDTAASYRGHTIRPGQLKVDKRILPPIKRAAAPTN